MINDYLIVDKMEMYIIFLCSTCKYLFIHFNHLTSLQLGKVPNGRWAAQDKGPFLMVTRGEKHSYCKKNSELTVYILKVLFSSSLLFTRPTKVWMKLHSRQVNEEGFRSWNVQPRMEVNHQVGVPISVRLNWGNDGVSWSQRQISHSLYDANDYYFV